MAVAGAQIDDEPARASGQRIDLSDVHLEESAATDGTHGRQCRASSASGRTYTRSVTSPITEYPVRPLAVRDPDPRAAVVASRVDGLVRERRPDLEVVHIGSSAVEGLPGKGVVDLGIHPASPDDVPAIRELLAGLGFQRHDGPAAFPDSRPLFVGGTEEGGEVLPIHLHVIPDAGEWRRQIVFRDALRADAGLRERYAALKTDIVGGDVPSSLQYSFRKTAFIRATLAAAGEAEPPILPPTTIGVLGGGQLGRMLALAARAMGYRIAVLDPTPDCPAAAVADVVIAGSYDDPAAARRLAEASDVVTYELEHVALDAARAVDDLRPLRPGVFALAMTQDRLAERRFLADLGVPTAEWREVRSRDDLEAGVAALGAPLRLKAAIGGYDGRSQVRIADRSAGEMERAWAALGARAGTSAGGLLLEKELAFEQEVSVVVGRDLEGRAVPWPVVRNVHDNGILAESIAPAPTPRAIVPAAFALAEKIATALDAVGVITVEMFQLPGGTLAVNELAPRVHNSGHWTIEGSRTSQFAQHIRAICGLPLGSVEMVASGAAMVNLLGTGAERAARPAGVERALSDPGAAVHLYDKRRVFERRKMGHVTVVADSTGEALRRARVAAKAIAWADAEADS
jgi:5-(carboxyamino)imidazole ribonucleotide synthase